MSGLRKLAGQTAIYGLPSILARLLNFLLLPLYTGVFTEAEYGIINNLYAYFAFALNLLSYGMETTYFRFSSRNEFEERTVYGTIFSSLLGSTGIFLLAALIFQTPFALFLNKSGGEIYVIWMALILSFDTLSAIPMARLRSRGKALQFALIRLSATLLTIALNVFWLYICPKYAGPWGLPNWVYSREFLLVYVLVANAFGSGLTLIISLVLSGFPELQFNSKLWKTSLQYGLPIMIVGIAGMTNETLDRILIERLLPAEIALRETGIYSGVYKLSMPISLVIMAFRYAAEPFFFSKYKDADNTASYARLLSAFVAALSVVFVAVLANLGWIAPLFLRRAGYAEGLDIVWILLLANMALGVFYNLTIWYKLTDQTMQGAWVSISAAILAIILNLALIPIFSYRGSAWATLLVYVYMAAITWWMGRKHLKVAYQWPRIFIYTSLAVIIGMLCMQFSGLLNPLASFIVGNLLLIIFSIGVYLAERRNPIHKFRGVT